MKSVDFLKKELKSLFLNLKIDSIKYEYLEKRGIHLIEVKPSSLLKQDEFAFANIDLDDKFIDLFPSEELIFITEDSLNKILNPIFNLSHETNEIFENLFNDISCKKILINNSFKEYPKTTTFDLNPDISDFLKKANNKTFYEKIAFNTEHFTCKKLANLSSASLSLKLTNDNMADENYALAA